MDSKSVAIGSSPARSSEPKEFTLENTKPSQVDLSGNLVGTWAEHEEKQKATFKLVRYCQLSGDRWADFKLIDYANFTGEAATDFEKQFFEYLVGWGMLAHNDGIYSFQDDFVNFLGKFVKK